MAYRPRVTLNNDDGFQSTNIECTLGMTKRFDDGRTAPTVIQWRSAFWTAEGPKIYDQRDESQAVDHGSTGELNGNSFTADGISRLFINNPYSGNINDQNNGYSTCSKDDRAHPVAYIMKNGGAGMGDFSIQYWYYYTFNYGAVRLRAGGAGHSSPVLQQWDADLHEGDWEHVSVIFHNTPQGPSPVATTWGQHKHIQTISWPRTRVFNGTHPVSHVAIGTHTSYNTCGHHPNPIDTALGPIVDIATASLTAGEEIIEWDDITNCGSAATHTQMTKLNVAFLYDDYGYYYIDGVADGPACFRGKWGPPTDAGASPIDAAITEPPGSPGYAWGHHYGPSRCNYSPVPAG